MMLRMGVFAALFAAFAVPAGAVPFTYVLDQDGGDGSVSVSQPAGTLSFELFGSNQADDFGSFLPAVETAVWFTYTGLQPFKMAVDWAYSTADAFVDGDFFGFYPENDPDSYTDLTDGFFATDSGQFEFDVHTGSIFGFYIYSTDDCCGRAMAMVTVANVPIEATPQPSPVPLPATAALMLPALGALRFLRRRAKAQA